MPRKIMALQKQMRSLCTGEDSKALRNQPFPLSCGHTWVLVVYDFRGTQGTG